MRYGALALLVCGVASCGGSSNGESSAADSSSSAASNEKAIERLIYLATPLDPTLTSDHHDKHLHQRRAYVAELRKGSRELGQLALKTYQEKEEEAEPVSLMVRYKLLEVASYAATEDTVPVLEMLLLEYGHEIGIRTQATELLGHVAPARAVELITPLLQRTKATSTMPDEEFLLKAYVLGCEGSGQDPVKILADVATNIYKNDAARHLAVKELGNHDSRLAQMALRQILVESTGNAYLRRKAAQSIRKSFAREEACAIFEQISTMEADNSFLEFLGDMIEENCE